MPHHCKECKESVSGAAETCPFCGTKNPTGMDPERLWLINGLRWRFGLMYPQNILELIRRALRYSWLP
jgi:hypothetical protein